MGNLRGLGIYLISLCAFLVAGTYTVLGAGDTNVVCSEQERLALLNFKHSVKDPYRMLSSWVGNDCCMWEGIHCDVTGNVKSLRLRGRLEYLDNFEERCYLSGNVVMNSSLAELKHLKYLDLSDNDFQGSQIPEFIGSMKQLTYLNLSHSGFQGNIPCHVGNLSNLKVLDLSSYGGKLIVDDMAWISGLSSLKHLDLSSVDLGRAQNRDMVFYMIPSLEELSLSHCGLSNADLHTFRNSSRILPNIKHLDLGFNSFKGPFPGLFQNMSSLKFLDLSSFNLSMAWNFANLLSIIPSLSELHLSYCGLDKTHLSSLRLNFSTLSNIQHLDLSHNSIEGTFPIVFTNMSSLKVLDLSNNMLNSSVLIMPNLLHLDLSSNEFMRIGDLGIWRQCHLKQLHASYNHFEIEMTDSPKNVSECSQYAMEWLDLSWGSNGTIPEALGIMTNLRGINLQYNRLTGPIPKSLGRLRYLEVLDLSYNKLTGHIPTFHRNLSTLDLSYNQLNGSIPESIGYLEALTYLKLRSNRFTGPIPTSLGRLGSLYYLDVFNNSLEGVVFEAHFANLSMLKHLDTSSNTKLTFNVSHDWIPPFQLLSLQLSACKIANGFPQWLKNQRKLGWLELYNASISGPLPTWLKKMPIIPFLDLSHNNLSGPLTNLPNGATYGTFPKCLENLQALESIIVSSNSLSGVIPSFKGLNSLHRLKLKENKFVGELPRELGNLSYLSILDVGDNKLCGNIPEWVGKKLEYLVVLRLHKNNFSGSIPRSLCKASNIHILDVAYNNLEGPIPRCLGELTAMVNGRGSVYAGDSYDSDETVDQVLKGVDLEYKRTWGFVFNMDLSSNKLVGIIPFEITTLSMLIGLNLSNNHLSGGISDSIGNMAKLESLDFSRNRLIGMIPPRMANLTFLSHLNLSHNNLSGRIPTGRQLQTLNDPSIYEGNIDLCGPPSSNNCTNPKDTTTTTTKKKHKSADVLTKVWLFYVDIICGFATGFWGVNGVLLLKKQWRWNLFMFAEKMTDKIYVAVVVRVAKIKRWREVA